MHLILPVRVTCLFDNPDTDMNYHIIKNMSTTFMYFLIDLNQCIKLAVPELFPSRVKTDTDWLALIINNIYKNLYK